MNRIATVVLREVVPRSPIFTTADVVASTGTTVDTTSRALTRMASTGLITRLTRGLWADTRHPDFSPYAVIPFLLGSGQGGAAAGYVSFVSALHLHGIVSQIPAAIHVAVADQRAPVTTPVARYRFHQLTPELMGGHEPGDAYDRFRLATPAKALFDTLYLSARRGRQFSHLPELDWPRTLRDAEMKPWIARIGYAPLRAAVAARWAELRERAQAQHPTSRRRR